MINKIILSLIIFLKCQPALGGNQTIFNKFNNLQAANINNSNSNKACNNKIKKE